MPDRTVPVKGEAFECSVSLVQQADTKLFQANPTLAIGDVKVQTDDGALANITTLPTGAAGSLRVKVSLSAAEMNGDNVWVQFSDAVGAQWCDLGFNIQTSARGVDDLAYPAVSGRSTATDAGGNVAADVKLWLAAAPNVLVNGKVDAAQVITSGTCQAGSTAFNVILAAVGPSAVDDYYTASLVWITAGTGAGQARLIGRYTGATKVADIVPPWFTTPDNTSNYVILPESFRLGLDIFSRHETAVAGGPSTITLSATNTAGVNELADYMIMIVYGTGAGQSRMIVSNTVGKVATVTPAWSTQPDNTSIYYIFRQSRANVGAMAGNATQTTYLDQAISTIPGGGSSITGSVNDAAATRTSFITTLIGGVDNQYHNQILKVTSLAYNGVGFRIDTSNATTGRLTLFGTGTPTALANATTFSIIADNPDGTPTVSASS